MAQAVKAKVFMSGRSHAVRIPAEFRFTAKEVTVRRDPATGDLVLSQKSNWEEIFAIFDAAGVTGHPPKVGSAMPPTSSQ